MIAARMSWSRKLEENIPSGSLKKGRNYFLSGAVRIDQAETDRVEATVGGGGRYSVVLELWAQDEILMASCTCAYYDDLNICKHIWAAILAAESEGHLGQIAEFEHASLEHESAFSVDDEEGQEYDSRTFQPRPETPKTPEWKERLEELRKEPEPAPSHYVRPQGKRRIIYVVDAKRSLDSGGFVVQAAASRIKKDGGWSKPAFHESSIRNVGELDAIDQKILALLRGSRDAYGYYGAPAPEWIQSTYRLTAGAEDVLIPILAETGRFFFKDQTPSDALLRLKSDARPPWVFRIDVMQDPGRGEYVVKGLLVRDENHIPLSDALLLVPGLTVLRDGIARFDDGGAFAWIRTLRKAGELRVPIKQGQDFLTVISRFARLPAMKLPPELYIEMRPLAGAPHLHIRPLADRWAAQETLGANVTFEYEGIAVPQRLEGALTYDPARSHFFKRDRQAETEFLNRLPELGFKPTGSWQKHGWELAPSRLPAAVRALVAEGWQVDAEGKRYRRSGAFNMNVASGVDWFELRGHAEFEGQRLEMPQLLKAIARGENTVRLGDGSYGIVPEEWLKRYLLVAALGKSSDGELRFELHQAGLLDALLAEQPEVTFGEGFARIRQELTTFAGIRAAEEPATFAGQLREYQRDGLGWLHFLRRFRFGGCLADDMGLGKTVQVLALLDSVKREHPSLIVAPRSLIFNWKQEAARFTPRLRILDYTGNERSNRWTEIHNYDVVLTTYGTLRRDAPALKDIHFDTVVLDEAQAIKNANTESAKAARLLKADHRLALTGTPVENRLADLWSLFEFLNPGLLGTASVFRAQIAGKNNGEPGGAASNHSLQILSKALRPFLLRRTKEQVARELPPKTEQTIYCELDSDQRRLYEELRAHYRAALLGRIEEIGIEKSRMQILEALLRLRQAACHPGLIDKQRVADSSAKLDALVPQIVELMEEGHKALVFSQFTSFLDIVRKRLDKEQVAYEYLDGQTRDREACVRRFQEIKDCPLFLISLKAGGLGLNLTAAEYVFLLDPWWNPAIEAQAIDRSHRIGQTRNVFAYRLIARDTVEEKILELQRTKRELAGAIITADNAVLAGLSRENLELLLS